MTQNELPQDSLDNQMAPFCDAIGEQTNAQEDALREKEDMLDDEHRSRETVLSYRAYDANAIAQERRKSPDAFSDNRVRERSPETQELESRQLERKMHSAYLPEQVAFLSSRDSVDAVTRLITEQERHQLLVDTLKQNIWLEKGKWKTLSPTERRVALEYVGRSLRNAYECPDPPLIPENFPEYDGKMLLGQYKDGDYDIEMNERILDGKDVEEALRTYCHEFRHAYQHEMVQRYDSVTFRHLVHNEDAAEQWSHNLNGNAYQRPEVDFEKYNSQPVEVDARQFSERIISALYETQRS